MKKLRDLRNESGFTQQSLAMELEMSHPTICRWEKLNHVPDQHRERLAKVLGCNVEDITPDDDIIQVIARIERDAATLRRFVVDKSTQDAA